jgi:predicted phage tail protein
MTVRKLRQAFFFFTFLFLASSSIEAATIQLAWDRSSDGVTVGYVIRYGTSPGNYTQSIDVGNVTSYAINTLTTGVRYYFTVQGYSSNGQYSPRSNEVNGVAGSASSVPSPPTNLKATVSGTSVQLSWQAPGGNVSSYRVEVGTSSGQSNTRTATTSSTSYTVTGLSSGRYYFRVRAINSTGQSAPSNEVTATVGSSGGGSGGGGSNLPGAPTNFASWTRPDGSLYLTWQKPSGTVTGYRLEVGRSSGARDVLTRSLGTATNYTLSGLSAGTYYLRVRAVNSAGVGAPSQELKKTVGSSSSGGSGSGGGSSATTPKPPSSFAAWIRPSDGAVHLTWLHPSGSTVTGYRIEVGRSSGSSGVMTRTIGKTTSYTVTGLPAGTYYFRARSLNGSKVSAPSQELKKTLTRPAGSRLTDARDDADAMAMQGVEIAESEIEPGSEIEITESGIDFSEVPVQAAGPASPIELTATRRGDVIDLSWQPQDASATVYRVEVGTAPKQTDVSTFTTGVTTSFSIASLPARSYYVRVRAGNELGFGEPTEDVVVAATGGPDAPRTLTASTTPNGGVTLAWNAPEDPTGVIGYVIETGRAPGRTDVGTFETAAQSVTTGPVPAGTYFVRVRSVTAAGAGAASNEIAVYVGPEAQCTAPPAVPQLTAEVAGSRVNLSIAAGEGDRPTGYLLDVGTAPGRFDIASIPLGADATTLSTEAANGSYALQLIAVNACGASEPSAPTVVTVGGPEVEAPGAPANLTSQVNERSVTLTWTPAATGGEVTSYAVEVVSPEGAVLLTIDTGNTSTVFTHGAVPPGEYLVRVRGVNARGAGEPSTAVKVTVQ